MVHAPDKNGWLLWFGLSAFDYSYPTQKIRTGAECVSSEQYSSLREVRDVPGNATYVRVVYDARHVTYSMYVQEDSSAGERTWYRVCELKAGGGSPISGYDDLRTGLERVDVQVGLVSEWLGGTRTTEFKRFRLLAGHLHPKLGIDINAKEGYVSGLLGCRPVPTDQGSGYGGYPDEYLAVALGADDVNSVLANPAAASPLQAYPVWMDSLRVSGSVSLVDQYRGQPLRAVASTRLEVPSGVPVFVWARTVTSFPR